MIMIEKIIYIIIFIVMALGMAFSVRFALKKDKTIKSLMNNQKAYIAENSSLKDKNIVFEFKVGQLEYYNDSILQILNNARKELKIKDSKIKQLQYLESVTQKTDTVVFRDTIFKDTSLSLDTVLRDNWYKLSMKLMYPNTIIVNPEFKNETMVFLSNKKETVNPPSKLFFVRWFQKKHTIVEVDVIQNNPYTENKSQKVVEIIK